MNKINIRDLRVGNWVRITEPDNFAGVPVRISSLSNQEGAYFAVTIEDHEFGYYTRKVFCEDIEPISITSNICDQVNDDHVILLWHDKKYEETGETWYELNICNMPDKTVCINIQYVHQLQNLLRDLGIEKEIII